jgi:hypothetical protein
MNDNHPLGLVAGLSNDAHHADPAIGSSGLKLLKRSPLHYWAQYVDPARERTEPTAAMKLGTAFHCALFEPLEYGKRFAFLPEGLDRRTKEGKALFAEVEAGGKTPLSAGDVINIDKMVAAALRHPISRAFLGLPARVEVSMFATLHGVRVKARPDFLVLPCPQFPNGLIVDGKSANDGSPEGFAKAVWNLDYHLQASVYTQVVQQALGTEGRPLFCWLAQESSSPWATAWYSAGDDLIEHGDREVKRLLGVYADCVARDRWPGYPEVVAPIAMPVWAQRAMQEAA